MSFLCPFLVNSKITYKPLNKPFIVISLISKSDTTRLLKIVLCVRLLGLARPTAQKNFSKVPFQFSFLHKKITAKLITAIRSSYPNRSL